MGSGVHGPGCSRYGQTGHRMWAVFVSTRLLFLKRAAGRTGVDPTTSTLSTLGCLLPIAASTCTCCRLNSPNIRMHAPTHLRQQVQLVPPGRQGEEAVLGAAHGAVQRGGLRAGEHR